MKMIDTKFPKWTDDQKLTFLENLSHELTIAIRAILDDTGLPGELKIEQVKLLNEIHHRVPMRARAVRAHEPNWIGQDAGLDIEHWSSKNQNIRHLVTQAVEKSIQNAEKTQQSGAG